jgi:putative ABC transport system permease protein
VNVVSLALRNLARNRRRTALSLAVVAAGTAALVLTAGFVRFSFDGLSEAMIHGGLGHLEIAAAAELERRSAGTLDRPASAGLDDWRPLRDELERLPGVAAVGANLHLMGLAQKPGGASVSFVGLGVEPDRERRMGFAIRLRSGAALAEAPPAPGADPVLLAAGLAESLDARVGDVVTLLGADPDGMLNALDVRVAGIVTTGVADLDTRWLKLPLASAQRLAQTERVSNLLVVLDDTGRTDAAAAELRARLAGRAPALAVTPWHERAPFYRQVRDLYSGIFRFLGTIVFVLVVLAASNTLVMTVFERMRELGVLRAMGATPGQISALVAAEALWLGLLGAAAGALLGAGGLAALNAAELRMPPPPGAVDPIDLRLAWVPEAFAGAAALMLLVLALAAIFPILRAIRIRVVDALGHV